ncbi:MAG TPA: bifunctional transaldolase/phosoglucose isomerase [Thermoleophilaceae bacterium]|nr:bifunctional transaldolase/phosoglucose isomerase [Thermoleophilaceae bacterium]
MNALRALLEHGQSPWYGNIRRALLATGELGRMVEEDGLRGAISNVSILARAISGSTDYHEALAEIRARGPVDPAAAYEELVVADIRAAADVLRPVYNATDGADGFVSLEIPPRLAHDTEGSVAEAERLWTRIERPNAMIKIPATSEGLAAIRSATGRGINVNATLLFACSRWEEVATAYLAGLEDLAAVDGDLARVASVASFYVSRIDTAVDAELDARGDEAARRLRGSAAIASAKLTYARWREFFAEERFRALSARGARPQRLLWASTGTKDPAYSVTVYVEALIGPETIATFAPRTWDAFRDHGTVEDTLERDLDEAQRVLDALSHVGVDLDAVTERLLDQGMGKLAEPFEELLANIAGQCGPEPAAPPGRVQLELGEELGAAVDAVLEEWQEGRKARRLWSHDASLWTGADESGWLGWLGIAEDQIEHADRLEAVARDAREAGFTHAVLLGMGGSSLAPEMLARIFGPIERAPELEVLDSTDPAQVRATEDRVPLDSTLFIVSSKSGSTLEPDILERHFVARLEEAVGPEEAPRHFVAVTDPGSELEHRARDRGFRQIAHGVPSIGGRYSALSNFGILPAAVMGVDARALLDRAAEMAHACAPEVPARDNPGVVLGAVLGVAANRGRDKVTLVVAPPIADLGSWLEQLLAESTGKQGRGLVPVAREPVGPPEVYGEDRLFVQIRLGPAPDPELDAAVDALVAAGHPVVRLTLRDLLDIGGEIFRWELATAVAGSVIGINPFDQPDVEASKQATLELTSEYERTGTFPSEEPLVSEDGLALFADARNRAGLTGTESLEEALRTHLDRAGSGDYVALLAYVPRTPEHEAALADMRRAIRDRFRVATVDGFGPRFLHSTGQAYKGGPNSGVFLQITCDHPDDMTVPGTGYTFGVVEDAQARGDLAVLEDRGRRAARVHLADAESGLETLRRTIVGTS